MASEKRTLCTVSTVCFMVVPLEKTRRFLRLAYSEVNNTDDIVTGCEEKHASNNYVGYIHQVVDTRNCVQVVVTAVCLI